jgi:peptidoglycan/LPS O-acetylase OafA/YrhL
METASIATKESLKPRAAERFYLPELDVLRFFAFFGVFVYHLPINQPWFFWKYGILGDLAISGVFGVDLFFTLSGYLITSLLLRERDTTGDINLKAFYARRTLRIWPLYYFVIGLTFLLTQLPASLTTAPFWGNMFSPMQPSIYFFMAIFLFNFNFGNGAATGHFPVMYPLWSISVEEQFYLFWPWFARYLPRKRIVLAPLAMLVAAAVAHALSAPLKLSWNNTFIRLDPIAVGILIALLPRLELHAPMRLALMALGIGSWVSAVRYCGLAVHASTAGLAIGYPLVALGSGAIVLAFLGMRSLRSDTGPVRALTYLGKISYGLYVYNPIAKTAGYIILFNVGLKTVARAGWPEWTAWTVFVVFNFGLTVAMAAVSYRWLESPFLRLKERFTRVPSRAV